MEFLKNEKYGKEIGQTYGDYLCTFRSDHHQVTAEVFQSNGMLTAYVSIRDDLAISDVTDNYLTPLQKKAEELGFKDRLKLVYTGR